MENLEQQLEALSSMIRRLKTEVDSLKNSARRQSGVADSNIAGYFPDTKRIIPSRHPGDEDLSSVASAGKELRRILMPLTHRETQILNYIADGNTNKQIAYILEISSQTIKNHISAILRKLNANDRAHAVALAMRNSWITTEVNHEDMVAVS